MSASKSRKSLPILDLRRFDEAAERAAFLAELRHAASEFGFFYLSGHGIPDTSTRGVGEAARRFFSLPPAVASRCRASPSRRSPRAIHR